MDVMRAVFWLISGRYEDVIVNQQEDDPLTKESWNWIQEYISDQVKLRSVEVLDAMLVYLTIVSLGSVPEFLQDLLKRKDELELDDKAQPSNSGEPSQAPATLRTRLRQSQVQAPTLAKILKAQKGVVPSFSRLPQKYRSLIVDALEVGFDIHGFLEAVLVPANLQMMDRLRPHGDDGFAFFCFEIFLKVCCTASGSETDAAAGPMVNMTEPQFQKLRPGLDALQELRSAGAVPAYDGFLLGRAAPAMSQFAAPEHKTLARLLCLAQCSDIDTGTVTGRYVNDAFCKLMQIERNILTKWLNADGIQQKPGFMLFGLPEYLNNAQRNTAVGIPNALRLLVRIPSMCEHPPPSRSAATLTGGSPRTDSKSDEPADFVCVTLENLANWAAKAGPDPGDFLHVEMMPHWHHHGQEVWLTFEVCTATYFGWMYKRGPTANFAWKQYWCVVAPRQLVYCADESQTTRKGVVQLGPRTRVWPFRGDVDKGESRIHKQTHKFGFVLDPEGGGQKEGRLYYFDAGDASKLDRWHGAIESAHAHGSKRAGSKHDADRDDKTNGKLDAS